MEGLFVHFAAYAWDAALAHGGTLQRLRGLRRGNRGGDLYLYPTQQRQHCGPVIEKLKHRGTVAS